MKTVEAILEKYGPCRSSLIVAHLVKNAGLSEAAARQRLSRAKAPVFKFPIPLLPNKEKFVYLKKQRTTEQFWLNFLSALREVNSIYAAAIDGIINRGGIVAAHEFPVISGAPIALKKQVTVDIVASNLIKAGVLKAVDEDGEAFYMVDRPEICIPDWNNYKAISIAESVLLGGLHNWIRNIGLASYNKISVRGSDQTRKVGSFHWDLCGPSYLLPLKGLQSKPGFVVADVFCSGIMNENDIRFFLKKVQLLNSSLKNTQIFPILIAEGFDVSAIKAGRSVGVVMASTENLFGNKVAQAIKSLIQTLQNATAIAVGNPKKFLTLLDDLQQIEGAAGNLRGVLFELISVYLAKDGAVSVDYSKKVTDVNTGKKAEIDVLRIVNKSECCLIECKGRNPGGVVTDEDVQAWVNKFPIFLSFLATQDQFRESSKKFEIWTTGKFTEDAIKLLNEEKQKRKKVVLDWRDGQKILELAKKTKEKGVVEALNQHFLKHPLA